MANLPDLRAKVKVDLTELDAATAKAAILGQALQRELGSSRGSEIDRSMRQIGTSVEDIGRKADSAGTAFIRWGDSGDVASLRIRSSTARTKADFDDLERRTRTLGSSLENEFRKGTTAVVKLGEDGSAALGSVSRQLEATGTASTQAGGGLLSMGSVGAVLVGSLVAMAAALAPIVTLLVAYTAGLAAAAAVTALALGGILGLAAGIAFLGQSVQGGMDPLGNLTTANTKLEQATKAHDAAVRGLTQAQAIQQAQAAGGTQAAQTTAQNQLTAAVKAHDQAVQALNQTQGTQADTQTRQMNAALVSAQNAVTAATTAHEAAVRRLQEAQVALQQRGTAPTQLQLMHIQDLQNAVTASADKLAQAQDNLATTGYMPTAAQGYALSNAQQRVQDTANAVTAAQQRLSSAGYTPSTSSAFALSNAQDRVTETSAALTAAQKEQVVAAANAAAPFGVLRQHIEDLKSSLGELAKGPANQIFVWLDKLLPMVQKVGEELIAWFGPRLPAMLQLASDLISIFGASIEKIAVAWAGLIDDVLQHQSDWDRFFQLLADIGSGVIVGLLTNLLRLSDWFLERLPTYQPVIDQIFGGLGSTIQAIGGAFGHFADWMVEHWPQMVSTIGSLWSNIQQGWEATAPAISGFGQSLQQLNPLLQLIRDHAENLKPILVAVGFTFGVVVLAIEGLIAIGIIVVAAIVGIATVITTLVNQIKVQMPEAGAQFSALGTATQQMGHDIGGVFSAIGTGLSQLGVNIQTMVREGGAQFSALGTAARQMQTDMGNVFSAIGAFLHTAITEYQQAGRDIGAVFSGMGSGANAMANVVGNAFSGLGGIVHGALVAVGSVFDKFGSLVNGALGSFGIHINPVNFGNAPFAQGPSGVHSLAQGGVIPGYAPGQDVVPAMLSPGEGVLTPQTVRGLGGAAAINALNLAKGGIHGLGALVAGNVGDLSSLIGSIAGQCVVAVEKWTGHFFPVAMASQMTRWINSATAAIGSIFVSTIPPYGHTGIVLPGGKVIDSNWGLDERVRIHNLGDIPDIAGYITGFTPNIGDLGLLASIGGGLPLDQIVKGLLSPLVAAAHGAADSISQGWARPLANSLIDQVANKVISMAAAAGITAGGDLGAWITQAIGLTGVPGTWAGPLNTLIGRESSGNPNAINRTDINAVLGHPSQGLMQLIPSNFSAYHVLGTSSNILDPVANIAAGIRYILARYGSIFNVQQANAGLPPRGYAGGGLVVPNHVYMVGERGPELFVSDQAGRIVPNHQLGAGGTSMTTVESLLGQVVGLLGEINGAPPLGRRDATRRHAT